MGAGARLPVERADMLLRRYDRAPGDVEVGEGAPLPVGHNDASIRRTVRTPGAGTVGGGARCSLRCELDTARCASALSAALCFVAW